MKTYRAKPDEIKPVYRLIDADGKILGRLATQVAKYLMGKHHARYTPNVLTGDFVAIVNAKNVRLTGRKESAKTYKHYTGYPGGLREESFARVREREPERIIFDAVRRMLPKNRLGEKMLKRLRVYAGKEHKQRAQKLVETKI
jgi:large subunit ribosomal protein L13